MALITGHDIKDWKFYAAPHEPVTLKSLPSITGHLLREHRGGISVIELPDGREMDVRSENLKHRRT